MARAGVAKCCNTCGRWDNRDLGDLAEIIDALRNPGTWGIDYRSEPLP